MEFTQPYTTPLERKSTGNVRPAASGIASTVLLAIAVLWCIYWFVHSWQYWEDDAYIHLEFARSVAAGQGFAFNGHVVAGDTAPLWVLLLAGMHTFISDWMIAGKVLTILGAAVGISGTYAFSRRIAAQLIPAPAAAIFPAAMVLLVAVNPFTCYWIFSGMEPIAAVGLAFFAVLSATRETPSTASFLTGCALAGIAPLVRPEMTFLTALLVLPLLGQFRRLAPRPAKLAAFAAGLVLLAGPLAAWSLYSLHAFGHLLPNTNAAKRASESESVVRHLLSIYAIGFPLIVGGTAAGIVYLIFRAPVVRRSLERAIVSAFGNRAQAEPQATSSLPLAGWIFILWPVICTVFYIANHTYVQTRYILVTAPGLTVVIIAVALAASRTWGRVVYAAALLAALLVSLAVTRPYVRNKGINAQAARALGLYIHDHLSPDTAVAVYSIGEIAFVSQRPIIDTGGITRPAAIPYLNQPPEAMVRWAQSEGAQYWIGAWPQPNAILVYSGQEMYARWTLHPSHYRESTPIELWKLVPPTEPTQPPTAPSVTHPAPE
jgi:hypothetical protein